MTPNDADVQIIADLYHTELRTLLKSNRKNRKSRQPDPVKLMLEYSVSERVHVHEPGPGPGRTWIWSDLHLRHANIISLRLAGRGEKIHEKVCRYGGRVPIREVWRARAMTAAVRRVLGLSETLGTCASSASNETRRS